MCTDRRINTLDESTKVIIFQEFLNTFEDDEIRYWCESMVRQMPSYLFVVPSSSSLKYHNATQCQLGGQIYHVLMACQIMNYILGLDFIQHQNGFRTQEDRDICRAAILLHDAQKYGNSGGKTVHEHPLLAAEWVLSTEVLRPRRRVIKRIAKLIASHSGQWTKSKYSKVILPKPKDWQAFIVHLADYLASRSDLDMLYSEKQTTHVNAVVDMLKGIFYEQSR